MVARERVSDETDACQLGALLWAHEMLQDPSGYKVLSGGLLFDLGVHEWHLRRRVSKHPGALGKNLNITCEMPGVDL